MPKPVLGNPASDQEQIASVHEAGLEICRKQGHLKSKHYNTKMNRIEIRCPRCGRLLGIEEDKCQNSS